MRRLRDAADTSSPLPQPGLIFGMHVSPAVLEFALLQLAEMKASA